MKITELAQYLTSDKARVRQDGMTHLVDNFETVLPVLCDNPRIASKLLRGLCHAIGNDLKDIQAKSAPSNISISRLRKAGTFFRELIEPLIDHCEATAVKDSPAYKNALKKSPDENPVENMVVLAKTIARDVVPHALSSIESSHGAIVEPLSKSYSTILSRIAQSHLVRSYLSPEHIQSLFNLCMRHLQASFEEPVGTHARTKAKAPHILAFATTFSRLLLVFPTPLSTISREIQTFYHQFLVGPRTDTILPHTLLSGLNFYLLRVANSQSDHLFGFLTSAIMDLIVWWTDSATIQLPKFPALRRECLVFFRLALFVVLGESTDDEHTMPTLLPMAERMRLLWRNVTTNMRRATTGTWIPLKASHVNLQWPKAGRLNEAEAALATAAGLEVPFSPLFPSFLRFQDMAFASDRGECVLEAWNSLWVAAEVFVRIRQLESESRERPDQPLEAAAEERPTQRRKAMTTLDELIDLLTSGSKDDEYAPSFICQLIMMVTIRYPKLWTRAEYTSIVHTLASTLNIATRDESIFWTCVCLAVLLERQPPPSVESMVLARSRAVDIWFRIHDTLLRRVNRTLSEPVFHLVLAMHLHLSLSPVDAPKAAVPPSRVFSPDTALTPSVLRFAIHQACINAPDWSIMDWVGGAIDWLLTDSAQLSECAKQDTRAVMGFMYALCGDFAHALKEIAHHAVPLALPVDAVIVEHELVAFMAAGRCLYDGVLPTPASLDFVFDLPTTRPDYVVRDTIRTLLARVGSVMESLAAAGTDMLDDSTVPSMINVAAHFASYCGAMHVLGHQALEAHPLVVSATNLVERLDAQHLAPADVSGHVNKLRAQLGVLLEMTRLVGLDGMRLDRYLSLAVTKSVLHPASVDRLHAFSFGPVRQALLKSFKDIDKLVANVVNLHSGNSPQAPLASGAAVPQKRFTSFSDGVDIAFDVAARDTSKDAAFAGFVSVVAQSHHNAHDQDSRLATCVGHIAAAFMVTYVERGMSCPNFLLDEESLATILVQGIVCLMRLPSPAVDLFAELLEDRLHLVPPAHADWLFSEAYDRLEAAAKDPVLGTDCMTVARLSFRSLAALAGTPQWTSDNANDLSDFFQFFMDRCGRTFAHAHFKVAVARFILAAARSRISVAKSESRKIDAAMQVVASDSLASVRLAMIQILPLFLDTADSPADLIKTSVLLAPPLPSRAPQSEEQMDVDQPKPSFEEFVVPVLYYARLAIVSEYIRTGALVELVQVLRDDRCACNPTQVMDMVTAIIGPSLPDFLGNYVPAMLFCLCAKGVDLLGDDFPFELVTRTESKDEYLEHFMTHVVVALAFHHKMTKDVLEYLAPIANMTVNSLMVRNFAILYASVLSKYYGTPEEFAQAKEMIEFVYSQAEGSDQQWVSIQDTVLSRLFLHTRDDFHHPDYLFPVDFKDVDLSIYRATYAAMLPPSNLSRMKPCFYARNQPDHTTPLLGRVLFFLAEQHSLPMEQMVTAPNLVVVLRSLHVNLEGSIEHPQEHAHWLHIYRLVLCFVDAAHLHQPFVFKFMTSSLLHLVRQSPLKSEVLHILSYPFSVNESYINSPYLLAHVIPALAHALITYKEVQSIAATLIDTLLVYHEKYTLLDPSAFPPFPNDPLLESFAARRQDYFTHRGLKETAGVLIHYLSTMPDNESIKQKLAPLVREGLLYSEAVKLTKVIIANSARLSATDVVMLGALYPTLFDSTSGELQGDAKASTGSAGLSHSGSTSSLSSMTTEKAAPPTASDAPPSPLGIVVQHMVRCMNEFKDFEVLQECAHLLRYIPQDEAKKFLEPIDLDLIAIAPLSIAKYKEHRALPAAVPPELTDMATWDSSSATSVLQWIRPLVSHLVKNQPSYILHRAERLMRLDEDLATRLFPHAIDTFARARPLHATILSKALSHVFQKADSQHLGVLSLCLDVLQHLHVLQREATQDKERPTLTLNSLDVARAAFRCKRTFEAMAFAERHKRMTSPGEQHDAANDLLMQVHQQVDDPDGIYGVNMGTSVNHLLATYEHEKDWFKALSLVESRSAAEPSKERPSSYRKCMTLFESLGFHRLLSDMWLQPGSTIANNIDDGQYQSLWRNHRWDIQATPVESLGFHGHLFEVTRALHDNQPMQVSQWIRSGLNSVASDIHRQALNASQVVVAPAKFDALLHAFVLSGFSSGTASHDEIVSSPTRVSNSLGIAMRQRFKSWDTDMPTLHASLPFDKLDLLLSVRSAVHVAVNAPADDRFATLLDHAVAARRFGQFQTAMSLLTQLEPLAQGSADRWTVLEQRARLHWVQGDHRFALRVLDEIISNQEYSIPPVRMGKILKRAGKWYSELKLLPAGTIVESYLAKATKLSPEYSGAYLALAKFAHEQYKNLSESEALTTLESQTATYRRDLQALHEIQWPDNSKIPSDYRYRIAKLQQQIAQDMAESTALREQCSAFVRTAVANYMQALATSDQHDLAVYSLCSLWLSTAHDDKLNRIVKDRLYSVPAHKFICLANQLTARLGCESDSKPFKSTLYSVVQYILFNHPHHILFHLIALFNGDVIGYQDNDYVIADDLDNSVKARIATVSRLLDEFKAKYPQIHDQYIQVTDAYVQASYKPIALRHNVASYPLTSFKISKLRNLESVPVLTAQFGTDVGPVPVANSPFPPYIHRFRSECHVPGGVNQPKAIKCIGSNGVQYRQLVKGNDDLRQDAGLMHVFQVADQLLAKHTATRTRQLAIRTYKVIPLAPQAGLLEWVEDTRPLYTVFSELHGKWPVVDGVRQITHQQARSKMGAVQVASRRDKIRVFKNDILPVFRPVFHNWFEALPTAEEWSTKRLAFTRSAAVTSIIGYIVGLGDRHPSNILFDEKTATLIHIDLGISFDAGSLLPIPEVVPFRLTQNMVDGMGPGGVEGVFRRCCEETLRVLRAESHVLYTILEVFKYDPLHNWTDPQKLARAQAEQGAGGGDAEEGSARRGTRAKSRSQPKAEDEVVTNKEAERALAGVRRKLGHRESVECQVSELIQEATNQDNLGVLFQGWQPYF